MFLVYASTVINRADQETSLLSLDLFRTFARAGRDQRLQFYSNVVMFVPVGILMTACVRHRPILWGCLFSVVIELSQLVFRRGFCETDDLVSNSMGVVIGFALHRAYIAGRECRLYRRFFKRFLDIVLSLVALVALSPVIGLTAVAVKLDSEGPIIFKQTRLGLRHREFKLYKFRSMVVNAEHTGSGVYSGKGDARVTRVGQVIRATSIDELPQLVNILKGDMSLIGPRPPLTYHPWPIDQYTKEQLHMFDVRPGITGWAQVHGRKDVEWHERIRLNNWYVDHLSLALDAKIFFMTILKTVTGADNENKGATV